MSWKIKISFILLTSFLFAGTAKAVTGDLNFWKYNFNTGILQPVSSLSTSTVQVNNLNILGTCVGCGGGGGGSTTPSGVDGSVQFKNGNFFAGDTQFLFNSSTNHLVLGPTITSPNTTLYITDIQSSTLPIGLRVENYGNPTINNTSVLGAFILGASASTSAQNFSQIVGSQYAGRHYGSGQAGDVFGFSNSAGLYGSGNATDIVAGIDQLFLTATGSTPLGIGRYIASPSITGLGVIGDLIGLDIEPQTAGTSTSYAIKYKNGSDSFYVDGNGQVITNNISSDPTGVGSSLNLRSPSSVLARINTDNSGSDTFSVDTGDDLSESNILQIASQGQTFKVTQQDETGGGGNSIATYNGGILTNQPASEIIDVYYNLARGIQFATGTVPVQRSVVVDGPILRGTGPVTFGTAATFAVSGPPTASTNATITNPLALWVQTGSTQLNDTILSTITGSTQCLHVDTNGLISGTGSDCGSGGSGGVSTSTVNNWSALQNFNAGLTFTNATGTNFIATSVTSTNFFATNANVTNLRWTNATGTNSILTNVTSTNFTATGAINVTGATFTGLSTADLSDVSNIAFLNANQSFTGFNSFNATTTLTTTTINGQVTIAFTTPGDGSGLALSGYNLNYAPTAQADTSDFFIAHSVELDTGSAGAISFHGALVAQLGATTIRSGQTADLTVAQLGNIDLRASSTIGEADGVVGRLDGDTSGATITNLNLLHTFDSDVSGHTVDSFAGLDIGTITGATHNWGIADRAAHNYMIGSLDIGTSTVSGFKLNVEGNARINGQFTASGTSTLATTTISSLIVNGIMVKGNLSAVTASIGGGLLTAGNCSTAVTTSVSGAVVGKNVQCTRSDGTFPTGGSYCQSIVSATDVVSTQVCALITVTPTSDTYTVTVIQ